jgi:site-specific recombinase XerC
LKFYSCLRALCNWLYLNDYLTDNPIKKVAKPRIREKILSTISKEQLQMLIEHCRCERDKALISLVERYSKSLTFNDAIQLYKQVNRGEVCGNFLA